ncbi:hypothetical protein [Nocardia otitidiscaviarum]|uniref:hypothetical protein n=1 Tax=Nocardia otitidiscaviarum TaxID=1823 RepID=UPI0011C0820B|nr:hypothetical protein [Nocardia otitidiscaviarum]
MTMVRYSLVAGSIALLALSTGCGLTRNSNESDYNRGQLCAEFAEFFQRDLSLSVKYEGENDFDRPVEYASVCIPETQAGSRAGLLSMTYHPGGNIDEPDAAYQPQKGFDEKVWIAHDNQFRVQIGSWEGRMKLHDAELSDEQTRKSIEFLIQATRKVHG